MRRSAMTALVAMVAAAAAPAAGWAAGEGAGGVTQPGAALPGTGMQDENFVTTASGLIVPEIAISRLGAERAERPEVGELSRRMVDDYTKLASQLEDQAKAAGLKQAEGPDPHAVNRLNRLKSATSEFDLTYLAEQGSLHRKLIAIYSMEQRAGQKSDLQTSADEARSVLLRNLEAIEALEAQLREVRTNPLKR